MKVGVASSGLGHVFRGMEAWATDLAEGLSEAGVDVTLFRGAGPPKHPYDVVLETMKRESRAAHAIARITSKGGWRIGLGTPHGVESFVFGIKLLRALRQGYQLVHVQQGSLGLFLNRAQRLGLLNMPVILANGQIASEDFLSRFEYVQHLTPFREGVSQTFKEEEASWIKRYVIPNFVDTDKYRPTDKISSRDVMGLPRDAFIVLTVGAINRHHKRMDYFIEEMFILRNSIKKPLHFIMAGAYDPDAEDIQKKARELLGEDITIYMNLPRERLVDIYNSADVFALCSLKEAFGIVIIEAMSCGVPAICHRSPLFEWIVGRGGDCVDMTQPGDLAKIVEMYVENPEVKSSKGMEGRGNVLARFSKQIVIGKTMEMYRDVLVGNQKISKRDS